MKLEDAFGDATLKKNVETSLNPGIPTYRIPKYEPAWSDTPAPLQFIQSMQTEFAEIQDASKELVLTFTKHKHPFFKLYSSMAKSFVSLLPIPFPPLCAAQASTPNNLTLEIDCSTFEKSHLEILIDFYSQSQWNPRIIERPLHSKIGAVHLAAYNLTSHELCFLLRVNDQKMLPRMYECASFFKFTAAVRLCFLAVGSYIGYVHNNLSHLARSKKRLRVEGALDHKTLMALQRKYPHIVEDSDSDLEDEPYFDDEYEDIDEEEQNMEEGEEEQYVELGQHLPRGRKYSDQGEEQVIDLTGALTEQLTSDSASDLDPAIWRNILQSLIEKSYPEALNSEWYRKSTTMPPDQQYEYLSGIGIDIRLKFTDKTLRFSLPGTKSELALPVGPKPKRR